MKVKTSGATGLWLVTAGLALLFLAIWASGQGDETVVPQQEPRPAAANPTPDQSAQTRKRLEQLAIKDATDRVDSRAKVAVDEASSNNSEIVVVAVVEGRPVSKLTYRAVPPDRVVFVKQEAP
jgi:hypothetical protein